jgi:nucleoside-diphosphate-sugar epimerase
MNWLIHQAMNGQPLTIYGDGSQRRDYVHIEDVVQAMLLAGLSDAGNGQIFNIGSGNGISFVHMAQLIVSSVRRGHFEHVDWPLDEARVETGDFVVDTSMIYASLGWKASFPLPVGTNDVVDRYRDLGQ